MSAKTISETLQWQDAAASKPDADTTVLVHCPKLDEPVWFGWYDGVHWFLIDGADLKEEDVRYWADLPAGPKP